MDAGVASHGHSYSHRTTVGVVHRIRVAISNKDSPQFRSEFTQFCEQYGIKHELSSPYNPESNGLAEAAVKNVKAIITRCNKEKESIKLALAAWRNITYSNYLSTPFRERTMHFYKTYTTFDLGGGSCCELSRP